ncbi:MAG: M20/M25/M40 family metallo-hydrolase [Chloroflexota bacterium]|nr:M20/M25/M40 family metallo-hydrolase [Chloroflexota bacterium]
MGPPAERSRDLARLRRRVVRVELAGHEHVPSPRTGRPARRAASPSGSSARSQPLPSRRREHAAGHVARTRALHGPHPVPRPRGPRRRRDGRSRDAPPASGAPRELRRLRLHDPPREGVQARDPRRRGRDRSLPVPAALDRGGAVLRALPARAQQDADDDAAALAIPFGAVPATFRDFDALVEKRAATLVGELKDLVRLPTVSAQHSAIDETAQAVLARARRAGVDAVVESVDDGPPTIVGSTGSGARTLLVYDHYDVQPPDPLDEWETPPFEPTERDGYLYARGVSDNKGNLMARLQALELYREVFGELPLRVRVLYEGEEEIGSAHLHAFVQRYADRIRADGCIWESGYKDAAGRPTLSLGLKGIAYFQLRVRGIAKDAHSSLATILPNAAWRLVWALSTLKNARDEITVDGLMDHVRTPSRSDLALLDALPFDEAETAKLHGVRGFSRGLTGTPLKVKHFLEPTCTICGLTSGYAGEGSKTVLPAVASAKLDFRLVPDLTPELVADLLRKHLDRRGFTDVEVEPAHGELPSRWPADTEVAQAAVSALRATYGTDPVVYPLMVGSGPMAQVCDALRIPVVGFGSGNAGSANHAPNENIKVSDYLDHVRAFGRFLHTFAGRAL